MSLRREGKADMPEYRPESVDADIVVGVDGTDDSYTALDFAMRESAKTGQTVNAVFGWTPSWSTGTDHTHDDEEWRDARHDIERNLIQWVDARYERIGFDRRNLKFTSVKATEYASLLRLGGSAQQIVLARRSMGVVPRWIMGSLHASVAGATDTPVTVVRIEDETDELSDMSETATLASATNGVIMNANANANTRLPQSNVPNVRPSSDPHQDPHLDPEHRPIVVGVDGSESSKHALAFGIREAMINHRSLHAVFCWQMDQMTRITGRKAMSDKGAQILAERFVADAVAEVNIPAELTVQSEAFQLPACRGLLEASRHACWLVVGSGESAARDHDPSALVKRVLDFSECPVTIVH